MKSRFIIYFLIIILLIIIFIGADTNTKGIKIVDKKGNEGFRWAICIGINDYWDDKISDLKKARNDAKLMGEILLNNGQFNKVFIMSDDLNPKDNNYPSKFNIEANINYITEMAHNNDLVIFHFSGHGISNKNLESFLLSADTRFDSLFDSSVKLDDVVFKLKDKGVKKILLLIDACREELSETKGLSDNYFNSKIYSESDVAATFYATKQGWYSYEDPESNYGIFTRFVADGLNGKGDANNDGIVSFSELEQYVTSEIYDYAVNKGYKQMPYTRLYGEKFGDLALSIANFDNQILTTTSEKKKIDVNKYATIYLYRPLVETGTDDCSIYFNNELIYNLHANSKINYKIYSEGRLYIKVTGKILKSASLFSSKIEDHSVELPAIKIKKNDVIFIKIIHELLGTKLKLEIVNNEKGGKEYNKIKNFVILEEDINYPIIK